MVEGEVEWLEGLWGGGMLIHVTSFGGLLEVHAI
jgi:hypothetical protein